MEMLNEGQGQINAPSAASDSTGELEVNKLIVRWVKADSELLTRFFDAERQRIEEEKRQEEERKRQEALARKKYHNEIDPIVQKLKRAGIKEFGQEEFLFVKLGESEQATVKTFYQVLHAQIHNDEMGGEEEEEEEVNGTEAEPEEQQLLVEDSVRSRQVGRKSARVKNAIAPTEPTPLELRRSSRTNRGKIYSTEIKRTVVLGERKVKRLSTSKFGTKIQQVPRVGMRNPGRTISCGYCNYTTKCNSWLGKHIRAKHTEKTQIFT